MTVEWQRWKTARAARIGSKVVERVLNSCGAALTFLFVHLDDGPWVAASLTCLVRLKSLNLRSLNEKLVEFKKVRFARELGDAFLEEIAHHVKGV